MKQENFGLFAMFFFFTWLMWASFVNGYLNDLYPMTCSTTNYDLGLAVCQNLLYFLPHLLVLVTVIIVCYIMDRSKLKIQGD